MSVAIVDRASGSAGGTCTISINPSGTNRLVLAWADTWDTGDVYTTATCGGSPMTEIASYQVTPARYRGWYKLAPSTGAQNVVITSTGGGNVVGEVLALSGVDQSTPLGTAAQANGNSTTATVNVPGTLATDLIIDNLSFFGGNTSIVVGAGQTSEGQHASGNNRSAVSSEPGNGGTVTMSWTWTTVGSDNWAIMAIRVRAAGSPTYYLTEVSALGSDDFALQVGGTAPAITTTGTGWTVGTVAGNSWASFSAGSKVGSAGFGATVLPPNTRAGQKGDGVRTGRYRGTIVMGTWTIQVPVVAVVAGGAQDGRIRLRIWRSSDPTGKTNAVEITDSVHAPAFGSVVTDLAVGVAQISVVSAVFNAITLTDEFLFFALAWQITGAGAGATADVMLQIGPDASITLPAQDPALLTEIPGFYSTFYSTPNFLTPIPADASDITDRLMSYQSKRGRADALSGIQAGTLSVVLDNDDAFFDPEFTGSGFAPDVKLRRGLQVAAQYGGIIYERGTVAIDSIAADPLTLGANTTIAGSDLYKRMIQMEITASYAAQTETARITALMTAVGLTADITADDAFSPPAASLVKAKLLDHLDLLVKAGRGQFWIGADGIPRYWGRHERLHQTSVGTFGAGGDYQIPTPQPVLDDAGLYNRTNVRRSASGANEVQRVTITGSPTNGAFKLVYEGATTYAIGWNSSPDFIKTALESLSTIGPGNVSVSSSSSGLPAFPVDIMFIGDLALRNLNPMTATEIVLTGGSAPTVVMSTPTSGMDPTQTSDDSTSQTEYGVIPFDLEQAAADLLASDTEAMWWAQWFTYQHAEPSSRFRAIDINPWQDPVNLWPIVLSADIGTVLTISHDLPGTKGMVGEQYYIEGIEEDGMLAGEPDIQVRWLVSKAETDLGHFWIVGVTDTIGSDLVVGF